MSEKKLEVAPKADPKQQAIDTIKRWLGAKADTLEALCGGKAAAQRFGQVLILACLRNPALLTCDLKSLFLAALYCAQRGLEPGVADGCALVPYKGQVVPVPQYRALVKQAIETGSVKSAKAILIHANDTVEWEEGMHPRFVHKPAPFGQDRGSVVGAYARIVLPDGTVEIEPMTLEQIYKRRDASAAWRDSKNRAATPWGQWEEEMIRKTALKNGLRTIPVAPRLRELLEADSRLEGGESLEAIVDIDIQEPPASPTPAKSRAEELAEKLAEASEKLSDDEATGDEPFVEVRIPVNEDTEAADNVQDNESPLFGQDTNKKGRRSP
jgi:recombination protein RecT